MTRLNRDALAESLAVWDLNDPQRNDAMLETIVEAARERLAQLPTECKHGKSTQHSMPVDESPGVNNAICSGKAYPDELIDRVFGVIYEGEDAPESRDLAVAVLDVLV